MQLNFDASTVNPLSEAGGFLPVSEDPRGHLVVITDWPNEPTENGKKNGHHVPISIKIIEGPLAGTEGVHRLNMFHNDEGPRKAAYTELSALIHVINGPNNLRVANSQELLNKPFRMISVRQKPDDPENTYTQLARNGLRDVNGNKPLETGGNTPTNAGPAIGGPSGGGGQPQQQNNGWNPQQNQGQPQNQQPQQEQPQNTGWNSGGQPQGQPSNAGGGAWQPQGGNATQGQPAGGGAPGGAWNPAGGGDGGKPSWVSNG